MGLLEVFLILLGGLGALATETCEIHLDRTLEAGLGRRLLPRLHLLSAEHLNPSVYLGLRLSGLQAGAQEALYLQSLKLHYTQTLLGTDDGNSGRQAKPSMGQLALYLLALRANCEFAVGRKGDRLVSKLKRFLEEEKKAMEEGLTPHTSYYQYSLGVLALCAHGKQLHHSVPHRLLHALEHGHLPGGVDTAAMAGLALTCLQRSGLKHHRLGPALRSLREDILRAQTADGHFGNVYSTPLALQLLETEHSPGLGAVCSQAKAALVSSLQEGAFQNALVISQLLPTLNHRSYADLLSPDCQAPRALLEPVAEPPEPHEVESSRVTLSVPSRGYRQSVQVPFGSSLMDVLLKARELGGFTTRGWGCGARTRERTEQPSHDSLCQRVPEPSSSSPQLPACLLCPHAIPRPPWDLPGTRAPLLPGVLGAKDT
ncbi:transcobalamin-2 isoform X2 [Erinaceus europaeus]|uniref:Transcobalamin-2 n=1 Tax=Erinaceus europaeus TaxID=9365 RepID=A0ABM3XIY2_ERIEU|nr:transcobalamin-2 isoform X2 [Erinaceus europaeus]